MQEKQADEIPYLLVEDKEKLAPSPSQRETLPPGRSGGRSPAAVEKALWQARGCSSKGNRSGERIRRGVGTLP